MILKINIYIMKYLKKYQKFFEDGDAAASGGTAYANAGTAGMGAVVSAQPGQFAGTTGTTGSGDVGFGLGATKKEKRKKGKPSQVSDLRDLKDEDTDEIKESIKINNFEELSKFCHDNSSVIKNDISSRFEDLQSSGVSDEDANEIAIRDFIEDFFKGNNIQVGLSEEQMIDWLYTFTS